MFPFSLPHFILTFFFCFDVSRKLKHHTEYAEGVVVLFVLAGLPLVGCATLVSFFVIFAFTHFSGLYKIKNIGEVSSTILKQLKSWEKNARHTAWRVDVN